MKGATLLMNRSTRTIHTQKLPQKSSMHKLWCQKWDYLLYIYKDQEKKIGQGHSKIEFFFLLFHIV